MSTNDTFQQALALACLSMPGHEAFRQCIERCWTLEDLLKKGTHAVVTGETTDLDMAWGTIHRAEEWVQAGENLLAELEWAPQEAVEALVGAFAGLEAHAEHAGLVYTVLLGPDPDAVITPSTPGRES